MSSRMILEKIPHAIPLKYRIEIMQEEISKDKQKYEYANVRIKIRRDRLIEDGIEQINCLPTLKSTIRVKMVNEFGLNEAGIDQDGVFKEFLLDAIKKILNPEFNLFQVQKPYKFSFLF
jgi:ubiquitin-protein ligase E3 B